MTDYTFIQDSTLLEEDHRVEDLLDFSANINDLTEQLVRIKNNSMVGLIGPYGCGKSTLLYQIYKGKGRTNKNINVDNLTQVRKSTWFTFDAWKYPERKDLWDGFVIDIAMQMNKGALAEVRDEIDGNKNRKAKTAVKTSAAVVKALALANMVPGVGYLTDAVKDILGNTLSSPPIKRVYEFQGLLKKLLNNIQEDIYIVVEDIDRSGDQGIFFLETLRYFIKSIEKDQERKRKIIIIVPMGEEVFKKENNKARDSYFKVIDYQVKFNPQDIKFDKFIKKIIDLSVFINPCMKLPANRKLRQAPKRKDINMCTEFINTFFRDIMSEHRKGSIRDIKCLLRVADNHYNTFKDSDDDKIEPMIVLLLTASEYFYIKYGPEANQGFELSLVEPVGTSLIFNRGTPIIYSKHWIYRYILSALDRPNLELDNLYFELSDGNLDPYYLHFDKSCKLSSTQKLKQGHYAPWGPNKAINLNSKYEDIVKRQLVSESPRE